jgi:hypothetical protein
MSHRAPTGLTFGDRLSKHQLECKAAPSSASSRNLRIIKRTPIAVSFCESCHVEFQSTQQVEEDAEAEMTKCFEMRICAGGYEVCCR